MQDFAPAPSVGSAVLIKDPLLSRPRTGINGPAQHKVSDLRAELGVTRQTLYRHVSPRETAPGRPHASAAVGTTMNSCGQDPSAARTLR